MIAVRLFSRKEILKQWKAYGCKLVHSDDHGFELWETGWGTAFTLTPELLPDDDIRYDQWAVERAFHEVILRTMPSNWQKAA